MSRVANTLKDLQVSREEAARKSHLPIERIEAIFAGEKASVSELRALSRGLRVPMHIFAGGRVKQHTDAIAPLFRNTGKSDEAFDVTVEKVKTFVAAALEVLPLRTHLPEWLSDISLAGEDYVAADRAAKDFRSKIPDIGPNDPLTDLPDIIGTLEGVILSRLNFSRYEGVSLIAGNYCFIFVSPRFEARMLFTLGHEIAHIVCHHRNDNKAIFDSPKSVGTFGRSSLKESFADVFSSCLLLPDMGLAKSIMEFKKFYNIENSEISDFEICLLSHFYGVSFQVAARRCEDLELIPRGSSHVITDLISTRYGSPEKRASALGVPPRRKISFPKISKHLADAIVEKLDDGSLSIGWVSDRFGLSIGEVFSLNAGQQ